MPVKIRKLSSGLYRVSTPGGVKSVGTTLAKAQAQRRILRSADNPDSSKGVAPAVYAYTHPEMVIGGKKFPSMHFFHLTEEIPGHVKRSTVSANTLLGYGYSLPPIPHLNMHEAVAPRHDRVPVDSIIAKAPPIYKLNWLLYTGVRGSHRLTPAVPLQMFPIGGYTNINFKHWGFDTYDVHIAFPSLKDLPIGIDEIEVTAINYQITVLGQDGGPSISAHYEHHFRQPICLGIDGLYAYRKIFRFFDALEHLPKLPRDWQYVQFIG